MTSSTVHSTLASRARALRNDDRGSLPLLMLVMIVTVALGGVMMATTINTAHVSSFSQDRVQEIHAAQTGIDTAVGQLRGARSSTDTTVGDSGRLPCGPWSGQADDAGHGSYATTIAYYDVDPATLDTNDRDSTTDRGGQKMLCTSAGPYNSLTHVRTPKYALITSTGTVASGGSRTLQTTYNFQVLDQNIPGGQIRLYPASSTQPTQWCMDAGSNPAVGIAVTLQACTQSNPPAPQQVWEYRADLSIELVESVTNPTSAGLCLDTGTSPTSHPSGAAMLLERCRVADAGVCPAGTTPAAYHQANPNDTCAVSPWNQQWSVDDNGHLEGAKTDQSDIDGMCINAGSQTQGVGLTLAGCAGGTTDPAQTWIPSPTTGAGMASAANQQLVNFQQFATCLDDTGQDVNSSYMILYTCKQNPNPAKIAFNQRFIPAPALSAGPTAVLLTVVQNGTTYCLKSPKATGGYPVLVQRGSSSGQCPASVTAAGSSSPFVWTVSQLYSSNAQTDELPYATRYTIKDSSATPLCLSPGLANDLLNGAYYKAIVTACNGSTAQKWNASSSLSAATFTNTTEMTTTG
jgi:hypothetical protein